MSVLHLTEGAFDNAVSQGVTLVDFWANWCGPCKMLAPTIDQLADSYDGKAVIAKVDVDAEPNLARRFGVMSIPTVIIMKDGTEVDRKVGLLPADAYAKALDALF